LNAVEIEEAVSDLVEAPFDRESFAFSFLEAFGNKATTIKKLKVDRAKKGAANKSDLEGGVLQTKNIHLLVCDEGKVTESLKALVDSPETSKRKAKYALATDGKTIEAENIAEGETLVCEFSKLADNFGFFLALAGITTVKEIRNNAFDIKATSRLNRLYVELLRNNPDWDTAERREEMNHFFARLIFCFFAEDTGIFNGNNLFTKTVEQMSDGTNAHEILTELFRAMNTSTEARKKADLRPYANQFPYVNGGLFSGSPEAPKFTKIARSYLIHVGHLDWTQINPDIFGSMIQAVADDEERGALGMHYTSVPNILKVLNPLFLDDLRAKLEEAGDNKRKLLNLRNRMARIRVFDPACGSGNFLVIAYKEMREIEAKINKLRGEEDRRSDLPLTNYRGIELRHFSAEIARLALIIAEYQCDVLYRGQKLALLEFLPLDAKNWITCGNALSLDWLKICPPTGTGVKVASDDLFSTPLDQTEMDFENEGGEIYVCGNPPYQGSVNQTSLQKEDMRMIFEPVFRRYKDLDYVAAFVLKAARFNKVSGSDAALVTTNSITQGEQVAMLWPLVFDQSNLIKFAHRSFSWSNLASNKAAVTCVIIGLTTNEKSPRKIFEGSKARSVINVSPYLVESSSTIVRKTQSSLSSLGGMQTGNMPTDDGNLILTRDERADLLRLFPGAKRYVRLYKGSRELINGGGRWCLWISEKELAYAESIPEIKKRIAAVKSFRSASRGKQANSHAHVPYRFIFAPHQESIAIAIPKVSSVRRPYLPCVLTDGETIVSNLASVIYDAQYWYISLIASSMHLVWIATVCGKLKTDYRYSNTLGWNTFPVPALTSQNKEDLNRCAKEILLARESHFPATIAELYDPEKMPENLRQAHERNDETLERIYIGRRFKNDTERLEKLFEMYTKMTAKVEE
jgi:hypothetical protein